jgi:uncharacterized membrane protein YoaK (UPF0700 family)
MGAEAYIHLRLVALSAAAGCVDAASFLGLDQVFVANQTGNTVLLGIAVGQWDGAAMARTGVALAGFCVGVLLGALALRGRDRTWGAAIASVVLAEAIVLATAAALWEPAGVHLLIALGALALGLQSAAAEHLGVPGVTTTFVTGTLTRIMRRVAGERGGPAVTPALVWLAYLAGAIAGGATGRAWEAPAAFGLAALVVALVAVSGRAATRRSRPTR